MLALRVFSPAQSTRFTLGESTTYPPRRFPTDFYCSSVVSSRRFVSGVRGGGHAEPDPCVTASRTVCRTEVLALVATGPDDCLGQVPVSCYSHILRFGRYTTNAPDALLLSEVNSMKKPLIGQFYRSFSSFFQILRFHVLPKAGDHEIADGREIQLDGRQLDLLDV